MQEKGPLRDKKTEEPERRATPWRGVQALKQSLP